MFASPSCGSQTAASTDHTAGCSADALSQACVTSTKPELGFLGESSASRLFRDFADEWFRTRVIGGGLRKSQVESDTCILRNHLKPYFGEEQLNVITVEMMDRYLAQKRVQKHQFGVRYSPKSLNNHLSLLRRILEAAREYEMIEKTPVIARHWRKCDKTVEESRAWWTTAIAKSAARSTGCHRVGGNLSR